MTVVQAAPLHTASSSCAALDALETLRQQGAARWDAVAWHYIEVLSNKLNAHDGAAQRLLQSKLDKALQDLQARMTAANSLMPESVSVSESAPGPTPATPSSPLAQLLHALAAPEASAQATAQGSHGRAENPRVAQFRKTLSQLSVHKQVSQALAQAPLNAGPINSHMLVLRSLGLMRQLSPDYLNRFMAYADTLLCLQAAGKAKPLKPNTTARAKNLK